MHDVTEDRERGNYTDPINMHVHKHQPHVRESLLSRHHCTAMLHVAEAVNAPSSQSVSKWMSCSMWIKVAH